MLRLPDGKVSASGPEDSRFETRFQRRSTVYVDLLLVKSDVLGQHPSAGVMRMFREDVPAQLSSLSTDHELFCDVVRGPLFKGGRLSQNSTLKIFIPHQIFTFVMLFPYTQLCRQDLGGICMCIPHQSESIFPKTSGLAFINPHINGRSLLESGLESVILRSQNHQASSNSVGM
ncbi:hypothetical protein AVEN_201765-1 [Araneus ventricosus]|uniref:Uncharacterized protein n=1 Tax=Araneus ventricosus TaxID=182803 RepID=A0A4Y2IZI8_ARAVE|nr:hypothetical protein AVEN_201765-1 [Araneus ventricosus]